MYVSRCNIFHFNHFSRCDGARGQRDDTQVVNQHVNVIHVALAIPHHLCFVNNTICCHCREVKRAGRDALGPVQSSTQSTELPRLKLCDQFRNKEVQGLQMV